MIKIPSTYDTLKIIRAFNERLRVAIRDYGENSYIVTAMKNKAKMVLNLRWSKTGKTISKSKENLKAINNDYLRWMVINFIQNNSAQDVINNLLTEEKRKEISKLKGSARINKIKMYTNKIGYMSSLLKKIWHELYDEQHWDHETVKFIYDELKAGNYKRELERYIDGEIGADELGYIIMGQDFGVWTADDLANFEGVDEDEGFN